MALCQPLVKDLIEAKNRKKTFSYDFPQLHHSIITPTVSVLTSTYAQGLPAPQIWCNSKYTKLWHFEKIGTLHFSLIGHHLESVRRTEPVFELKEPLQLNY